MATKTRKRKRPLQEGDVTISQLQRVAFALRMMPENRRKGMPPACDLAAEIAVDDAMSLMLIRVRLMHVVQTAEKLGVDPRWLATGESSPAAYEAIKTLRRWPGQYKLPEAPVDELVEWLHTTIQPDRFPGTCRYCLCTDEQGCGECWWVDPGATICSACLLPTES